MTTIGGFFRRQKFGWVPEVAKRLIPFTGKLDEFRL
jgi:hypothetical protein